MMREEGRRKMQKRHHRCVACSIVFTQDNVMVHEASFFRHFAKFQKTTSTMAKALHLVFAPLPDDNVETSAAREYALRAKHFLEKKQVEVYVSPIDENLMDRIIKSSNAVWLLLIISCGADGSIHRLMRKAVRNLKSSASGAGGSSAKFAVALLGHARCANSAIQTEQTIFGAGRRIEKTLSDHLSKIHDRIETQVELVGPEQEFDPFLESLSKSTR